MQRVRTYHSEPCPDGSDSTMPMGKWMEAQVKWFISKVQEDDASDIERNQPVPARSEITFPPSLTSEQRKLLHIIARRHGLHSESIGLGADRSIRLFVLSSQKGGKESAIGHITRTNSGISIQITAPMSEQETGVGAATQPNEDIERDSMSKSKRRFHDRIPKHMKGLSEIIPSFLYLGSGKDARDDTTLKAFGIRRILCLAKDWITKPVAGFEYSRIDLNDSEKQDILPALKPALEYLEDAFAKKEPVLVHCVMGKSRSATIVIAYLMKYQNMSVRAAFHHVFAIRNIVKPNRGFMRALIDYEGILGHADHPSFDVEGWVAIVGEHGSGYRKKQPKEEQKLSPTGSRSSSLTLGTPEPQQLKEFLEASMTKEVMQTLVVEITRTIDTTENKNNQPTPKLIPEVISHARTWLRQQKTVEDQLQTIGASWKELYRVSDARIKEYYLFTHRSETDEPSTPAPTPVTTSVPATSGDEEEEVSQPQ